MVAKFSFKRSWQTFLIVFYCIFQIFWKIFSKMKKLSCINFYRNLITWFGWSVALMYSYRLCYKHFVKGIWYLRKVASSCKKFGPVSTCTEKKDLIESKKIICLNDFLWFKEMICLNETKFVLFRQNIFGPNKYLFESNKFLP